MQQRNLAELVLQEPAEVSGGQQRHRSVAYDKHEAGKTTDDVAGAQFGNVPARFRCYYLGFFIF